MLLNWVGSMLCRARTPLTTFWIFAKAASSGAKIVCSFTPLPRKSTRFTVPEGVDQGPLSRREHKVLKVAPVLVIGFANAVPSACLPHKSSSEVGVRNYLDDRHIQRIKRKRMNEFHSESLVSRFISMHCFLMEIAKEFKLKSADPQNSVTT